MIIELIKVPEGPAPIEIRKEWVGVILVVISTPKDFIEFDAFRLAGLAEDIKAILAKGMLTELEYKSLKEREAAAYMENRGGCMVPVEMAIRQLGRQKSAEVVDWFLANWPDKKGWFLFGPDEYRVLQNEELN